MKKTHRYKSDNERNIKGQSCYNRGLYEDHQVLFRNVSDDTDTEENIFLRPCRPKEDYLEKQLEPGDTLQTLSIQFNCPVAELKRINNIHRDNEVFARRIIKVPVKYYSLLSEKLVGVHKSSNNGKEGLPVLPNKEDVTKCSVSDSPSSVFTSLREHRNSVDDIFSITNPILSEDVTDYEDSSLLLPNNPSPQPQVNTDVFQCSGSDWGLSWPQLLSCTILLLLGGPIIYLLYHADSGGLSLSSQTNTNSTMQSRS